ncbi:arylamine N-acetyltransferase [Kitasatospora griseola]|nr:arylamine N-acetyltransferase [Kitasatospora griseola]GGQ95004.1 arylamine N-acetyltransferase [Kitasatospora griseola]
MVLVVVDLEKYFARIGWDGGRAPTLETFRSLHRAHVIGIPFENLDVVAGGVPSLDLDDLQAKLVESSRGGYCFEHNSLFGAVLEQLGFQVTRLSGRVRYGARPGEERPRTHMVLAVEIPGVPGRYLADVGFGGLGALLEPLPMVPGQVNEAGGRRHRLVVEETEGWAPVWVMQAFRGGVWEDQTAFTLDRVPVPDLKLGNWFTATHPRSPFHRLFVQRTFATGHHLLLDTKTVTRTGPDGAVHHEQIEDADELLRLLESDFGIAPPTGLRLPADVA